MEVSGHKVAPEGSGKPWFYFVSSQSQNKKREWKGLLKRGQGEMSQGDPQGRKGHHEDKRKG